MKNNNINTAKNSKNSEKTSKINRKLNENWQYLQNTKKYRKARSKEAWSNTCQRIAEEMLDGIFINLNGRHSEDSPSIQKKLMRRVIEKRQAQATFRKTGRTRNLQFASEIEINTRKCIEWINRIRYAG